MWIRRNPRFLYPISPVPRTAVISRVFRSRRTIRVFEDLESVPAFAPQALAGTLGQVESLAGSVRLTHAIIVFRGLDEPRLTDVERDRLWQAFEVPLFEQILASNGELLAWECEAHEGLHAVKALPGLDLERTPCACGHPAPRIVERVKTHVAATT